MTTLPESVLSRVLEYAGKNRQSIIRTERSPLTPIELAPYWSRIHKASFKYFAELDMVYWNRNGCDVAQELLTFADICFDLRRWQRGGHWTSPHKERHRWRPWLLKLNDCGLSLAAGLIFRGSGRTENFHQIKGALITFPAGGTRRMERVYWLGTFPYVVIE